jgi:hypothetical protein
MSFLVDWLRHHRHAKAWPRYLCLSSPELNPDSALSYIKLSTSYCLSWKATLTLRLHLACGSNNLLLHHSFGLMSLPIDYIFMEPSTKFVVIIANILTSSKIWIEFMMGKIILAPRWFVLPSTAFLPSLQHKLVHVLCCTLSSFLVIYSGIRRNTYSRCSSMFSCWCSPQTYFILYFGVSNAITLFI